MPFLKFCFLLLLLLSAPIAQACTYEVYKKDSLLITEARAAMKAKSYANALAKYQKTACFENLSTLDKIQMAAAYAHLGNRSGVDKTLRSIDVRFFIQGGDPMETLDIFMTPVPDTYKALKEREKLRLKKVYSGLRQSADFRYLEHMRLVDQAVRGNVYHDSLQHYADYDPKARYALMWSQSQEFYAYVRKNGWPGYSVGGHCIEILATHDLDHLKEHLDSSIVAAEKGEGDWIAVENLTWKMRAMKNIGKWPPPTQTDTIKQNFFDNDCRFLAARAKPIADSLLKHIAGSHFVEIEVAFDSSYTVSRQFSTKHSSDMCPHYAQGSISLWLDTLFEKNPVLKPYRTPGSPNRPWNYYKDILRKYNQPSVIIIKYYK